MLGQQMLTVVVGWDLYEATHSPLVLGNVGLVQILPAIFFTFVTGYVADHYDRQKTAYVTQLVATVVGLALALAGAGRSVTLIYTCLFLIASARAFQWPATTAMLSQTVPMESMTNAVSWSGSAREMATVIGPAIAGGMIALWGSEIVYYTQGLCTLLAALSYWMMRLPPRPKEEQPPPGWQATMEGLRFVWREKIILYTMSLDLLAVLFGGAVALLPIFADEILKVGASGLGWMRAAPAVGAGLMSLALAHRPTIGSAGKVLLWSVALFGVATVGFAYSTNFWLSLFLLFLTGAFDAISVVLRISLMQMRTPDALRGRVAAVNSLFISSSNQWGAVESGVAANMMGTVPSVAFGGIMTIIVVALIGWGSRSLREWRN
jgi:MFS family permease